MQVNSVSSNNAQSFGRYGHRHQMSEKEYLEAFAQLSDKDIQKLAYAKASHDVNDKKHNRISNGIFYSIPLAAGLASATGLKAAEGATKVASRMRGLRLATFAATALSWLGTFAAIDLTFGAKRAFEKHNKVAGNFTKENPILSTLIGIGAAFGVITLGHKGLSKISDKIVKKVKISDLKEVVKLNNGLKNSKFLNNLAEKVATVPSSIKNFAKGVISWGPMLLITTHIVHTMDHSSKKQKEVINNYNNMKNAQAQIREAMARTEEVAED